MFEKIKNFFSQKIFSSLKLINDEGATIMQVFGFVLVLCAILYLFINVLHLGFILSGEKMAIIFLLISLGISFIFPKLLEGGDGNMSTMRYTVFIFSSVICMLILKIGWTAGITNLGQIGLDGYWVEIIGLLFGAKFGQSYFELKNKTKENSATDDSSTDDDKK